MVTLSNVKNHMTYSSAIFVGQKGLHNLNVVEPYMANKSRKLSSYFFSLKFSDRKFYLEKLKIGDQELDNPFAIDEERWSEDLTK